MVKILNTYTNIIILINVIFFILIEILGAIFGFDYIFSLVALQPSAILAGQKIWTLITSMFMHGSFFHLFFNMFSLFFIGTFVERLIGKKRFLGFYLGAGIFAGIFFALLAGFFGTTFLGARLFGFPDVLGVGASGAIFGLLGILALLTPKNKVYLIVGPLIAIILQAVLDSAFPNAFFIGAVDIVLNIYILLSIFFIFSFNPKTRRIALPLEMPFWVLPIIAIIPLLIIGLFVSLPIGNAAHIGGLIFGLGYALYLKIKYPKKTLMISKYFSK